MEGLETSRVEEWAESQQGRTTLQKCPFHREAKHHCAVKKTPGCFPKITGAPCRCVAASSLKRDYVDGERPKSQETERRDFKKLTKGAV
ncbi:hypothetical protein EYF80_040005 [Liparis tanakae]|uniref:Uncharacterized protein n=1 Tax=Liparis tanakae TaxID=230148 RepID=A0A4Z2G8Z9_9TELE|nr:hypothetical protein EYF80_040005 [Liparis tanakae]